MLAEVGCRTGEVDRVVRSAELAVGIHRASGYRCGQARALVLLGQASPDRARRRLWAQALSIFSDLGLPDADRARALIAELPTHRTHLQRLWPHGAGRRSVFLAQ